MAGAFMHFGGTPALPGMGPPEVGEHSLDVLEDLGFDAAARAALVERRVVGARDAAAPVTVVAMS
jgi:crotonobetainyl-CoA:carnitine CoA-transferase CaiB-like acyl-CoA transferase